MKTTVTVYEHAENGIALHLEGETEIENKLLAALWKHGRLEVVHHGYSIQAFGRERKPVVSREENMKALITLAHQDNRTTKSK